MIRLSDITNPFGRPVALAVNPVTPPVAAAVNLKVISPLVKVLGLLSPILVVVLSH